MRAPYSPALSCVKRFAVSQYEAAYEVLFTRNESFIYRTCVLHAYMHFLRIYGLYKPYCAYAALCITVENSVDMWIIRTCVR